MKHLKKRFEVVGVSIALIFVVQAVYGASTGQFDTRFGTGGTVETVLFESASIYDIAVQSDGKVVAVGTTFDPMRVQHIGTVARFNLDGTLDTSFDNDGFINSFIMKSIGAVRILSSGKILVGGHIPGSGISNLFCIARLNTDGSLDTSFNGTGIVSTSVGIQAAITALNILPDGKIIASGWTVLTNGSHKDFALVKYNTDGSLDTSFGSGGRVATDTNSNTDELSYDAIVQPDGKIVVAGYKLDPLPNQRTALIIRYNSNGSLDSTFGNNGVVTRSGTGDSDAYEVAIQSTGKIIVVGPGIPPLRFNTNGSFDTSFDSMGMLGLGVHVQTDDKILFAGGVADGGNFDFTVGRYNADGSIDTGFGTGGKTTRDFDGLSNAAHLAIAPDGKIIAGGQHQTKIVVGILLNQPRADVRFDFDGDSKTDISVFRPGAGQWWYLRSSDFRSRAYAFGTSTDKLVPADFTGDGKTDIAFWREASGEWFVLRSEDDSFFSFPFGISGDIPAPGDYDGDGKADAAVFRPSSATWFIQNSSGGSTIQRFGIAEDKPVVGDYDGDGKDDIAIFRPSVSQWWLLRSGGGVVAYQPNFSGGIRVAVGDVTGDGKNDITFFRPSSGEWYVLRSEDNSFYSVPFGLSTDIPTLGDYDGDGKADTAVFRPSDNNWYIQGSKSGFFQIGFGQSGDIPVPAAFVAP